MALASEKESPNMPGTMLRISDIKQYIYCPRIIFYSYVMPVEKKTTFKMEHGKVSEEQIARLESRRKLKHYGLDSGERYLNHWVKSDRLALSGKVDMLIRSSGACYPVDFKYTRGGVRKNHIYQLCGYALILEDLEAQQVQTGFIYLIPESDAVPVEFTNDLKHACLEVITKIQDIIEKEAMPAPNSHRSRCQDCEYRNYCRDVWW
jgi:CRISPR-associated exonuclease Cas4